MKKTISSLLLILLVGAQFFSAKVHAAELGFEGDALDGIIVSSDPIHPYIHALFNNDDKFGEVVLVNEFSEVITEDVKKAITKFYKKNDSKAISDYLVNNSIDFQFPNKQGISTNARSTTTKSLYYSDLFYPEAYNKNKTHAVTITMLYEAKASIDISNNKIIRAGAVTWTGFASPYIGNPFNLSKPHYIINNGYTSRITVTFGMEVFVVNSYYRTNMYSKTYFYHVIAQ